MDCIAHIQLLLWFGSLMIRELDRAGAAFVAAKLSPRNSSPRRRFLGAFLVGNRALTRAPRCGEPIPAHDRFPHPTSDRVSKPQVNQVPPTWAAAGGARQPACFCGNYNRCPNI